MRQARSVVVVCTFVALVLGALVQASAAGRLPIARAIASSLSGASQRPAQSAVAASKLTATVTTDQEDYPPDTQVNVAGTGWLAREVVELTFTEIATDPPGGHTDGPFIFYATSDPKGNISNGDFYTDEHDIGVTFQLDAKGVLSGRTARTTFTDGVATLSQCANDSAPSPNTDGCNTSASQWVSGNLGASKSTYREGDSIPYQLAMTGLVTGSTVHTVTIEWDTTKSSKHALDYLTTFNRTVLNANPCLGVSPCGTATTALIPLDLQLTGTGAGGKNVTPDPGGVFTIFGGNITGFGNGYSYANGDGFAGDKSARITISFTTDVPNPVLAWGGHIATRLDWGIGASAVAISGSPYHTRLVDVDGSGGNQDRSLSADAVIFPGAITIVKQATPESSTSFGFTASPSPLANFSLVDDGIIPADNLERKTFSNITSFTTYTVAETPVQGWTLSFNTPVCTVASANGGTQTSSSNTVTINLKEGEIVSCTFINTRQAAHLIVHKHVVNDNGGTANASAWTLQANGTDGAHSGTPSPGTGSDASIDFTVDSGTYTVSETGGPTGYLNVTTDANNGDCDGSNAVTLAPGQTKNCTITNDDQAPSLTLNKVVVNDNGGAAAESAWTLTADGGAAGTLSGPGAAGNADVVSGSTFKAGTYALSESTGPTGYTASAWSCVKNGGAPVSGASITLGLNDTATCTITNNDQGPSLTLNKVVVNDNGGAAAESAWTLTANGGAAGTLSGPGAAGNADVVSGSTFKAGTYALSESTGPTGYTASAWSCVKNGGAPVSGASITLGLNDTATCTITNDDQAPSLTLNKVVVNDNGGTAAESAWTLTANGGAAGTLSGPGAAGNADVVSGSTFKAGTYALSESTGPTGYTASAWSCVKNGGAPVSGASITLGLNDTATCTITNNDQGPGLILNKVVVNDNGGTAAESAWTLTADGGAAGTLSGPGAAGNADVVSGSTFKAGTYALSESTGPTGYTASAWNCVKNGGAPVTGASITLGLNDTATCTITNNDQAPSLTLNKVVVNDNGGTALESAWTLTANGGAAGTLSGPGAAGNADVVSGSTFKAGTYALSESTGPAGYTASAWSCVKNGGAPVTGASITLGLADTATCTITNDDAKASPTGATTQSAVLFDQVNLTGYLSGGGGPNTVTFFLYSEATCNTQVGTASATLNAAGQSGQSSPGIAVTTTGIYYWKVVYAGDNFNSPFTSHCGAANDEKTAVTITGS